MTTRKRRLPDSRSDSPDSARTLARHWTREEQIENAYEDGTENEMQPPLKPKEIRK